MTKLRNRALAFSVAAIALFSSTAAVALVYPKFHCLYPPSVPLHDNICTAEWIYIPDVW